MAMFIFLDEKHSVQWINPTRRLFNSIFQKK